MPKELPPHEPSVEIVKHDWKPAQLQRPFVFEVRQTTYRFAFIQVDATNHNDITPYSTYEWVTELQFQQAGLKWGERYRNAPQNIPDATAPEPGTATWERDRANRAEATVMAIHTMILAAGGYQYVQTKWGDRQENTIEALARMLRDRPTEDVPMFNPNQPPPRLGT